MLNNIEKKNRLKRGQTGGQTGSNGVIASPIIISSHPPPQWSFCLILAKQILMGNKKFVAKL